jgi:fucose 4-O-acetylase-like acetyltransferase
LLPLFVFVSGFFAGSRVCKQEQHRCLANTCEKK